MKTSVGKGALYPVVAQAVFMAGYLVHFGLGRRLRVWRGYGFGWDTNWGVGGCSGLFVCGGAAAHAIGSFVAEGCKNSCGAKNIEKARRFGRALLDQFSRLLDTT